MEAINEILVKNFEVLTPFENLINYCVMSENAIPESLCQEISLAPNETITLHISLKDEYYSIEPYIYICSEDPFSTEYTIYGEDDVILVPTSLMMPTETTHTEKIFFYSNWARKKKITFVLKNKDQYRGFKVWIKGYILYINMEFYSLLEAIISRIEKQIHKQGIAKWDY